VCCPPELPWEALSAAWPAGTAAGRTGPVFGGGWIGYLGFGLAGHVLPVPPAPGVSRRLPAWWLGYYDHVLRRDRASGQWFFEALQTPERAGFLDRRLAELRRRARGALLLPRGYACGDFRLIPSAAGHKSAVRRAVEYIRQGDIFQANICLRLEAGFDGDPLDAFCQTVNRLDPPYAAFLRLPEGAVASLSPELFLQQAGTSVVSRPIKGTHARSARGQRASVQLGELECSAKNRAENVMIVDLMRNDLSRVCVPGSVEVPRLAGAEPHPGVWHLVSEVRGQLSQGSGHCELIRAAFPPGSVTGAPKVRAIEIIHELETTPREVYTGAVGYRSPVAGLELNVAIRTFEFHGGRVWLGAGGGIVAASRPGSEYQECLLKASPLIGALGSRISSDRGTRRRPAAPGPLPRPRPAAGVFTSLLVHNGTTHRIGDHLTRLDASARELFGKGLPPALDGDLANCLRPRPSGRLRITVRPLGGPLRAAIQIVPLENPPPAAVDLHPVLVPGGLGGHKWRDRGLLARHQQTAGTGPGGHLLIEDTDGHVLETDRASIFAMIGGILRTPPPDGRLLPGVTRAAILRLAATHGAYLKVMPMTRADLMSASEVFVTNSVHGVLPVRSIAGTRMPAAGSVTARLAAALTAEPADSQRPPGWPSRTGAGWLAGPRPGSGAAQARRLSTAAAVVVIDNYDSFTYNLVHLLSSAGCTVEVVRNDEVTAGQVAAFGPAGVMISPGPCTPADAGISIEVVRCCGPGTSILGICLGHQAIAVSFGARVIPARRPVHGEQSDIVHDGHGVLAGLPRRFAATRYHSLAVDEQTVPPCLRVTARTRGGIPMALQHTSRPIEGVQFHPESILTTHGETIMANFARALHRGQPEPHA
jgi:para-aminobenzoate synthetase/4-amino-4-deoxychorismate lyase